MKLLPLLLTVLFAYDMLSAATPPKRPSKEEMKRLMSQMRPGSEHDLLSQFSGEWELTLRTGRNAAGEAKGSAISSMILGNRFLDLRYQAKGPSGAFEGTFTLGFDRRHEHYTLVAMDTSGTYFVTSKGRKNKTTGKLKLYGTDDDPFMKSMGYTKEFAHQIDLSENDRFSIQVLYVDTRTPEKNEKVGMIFEFTRSNP